MEITNFYLDKPFHGNVSSTINFLLFRTSHQRRSCSIKTGALKNVAKFTGKHTSARVNPEACNFIKKETLPQVFPVNYAKFVRITFLQNTSARLLLILRFFLSSKNFKNDLKILTSSF